MDNTTSKDNTTDLDDTELEDYLEENAVPVEQGDLEAVDYSVATKGALPLYSAINAALRLPVKDRHILWLPGKTNKRTGKVGDPVPYIPWNTASDYLDHFATEWHYIIIERKETPTLTIVHARIVIVHARGETPRDALGEIVTSAEGFGTVGERAESKALRRAAAKHGLARHLYSKAGRPAPPPEVLARFGAPERAPDAYRKPPIGLTVPEGYTPRR